MFSVLLDVLTWLGLIVSVTILATLAAIPASIIVAAIAQGV